MHNMWHNHPDPIQERYQKSASASKDAVLARRIVLLLIIGLLILCCACALGVYLEWGRPLLAH